MFGKETNGSYAKKAQQAQQAQAQAQQSLHSSKTEVGDT
jgi:hypothetical protein